MTLDNILVLGGSYVKAEGSTVTVEGAVEGAGLLLADAAGSVTVNGTVNGTTALKLDLPVAFGSDSVTVV